MPLLRTAARKDANHNEIVRELERCGWSVLETYQLKDCCDCIAAKQGRTVAIEIKPDNVPPSRRKLTKGEQEFKDRWKGEWRLIQSVDDVLAL